MSQYVWNQEQIKTHLKNLLSRGNEEMRKEAIIVCHGCGAVRGTIDVIYVTDLDDTVISADCLCIGCKRREQDKQWQKFGEGPVAN
jgi:hypothetical protein